MGRAHREVEPRPARRRPGGPRRAGRRRAPPARWPRGTPRGGSAPTARGRRGRGAAGPPGRAGRRRPPRTAAAARSRRGGCSSTSHTETATSPCVQARAERTDDPLHGQRAGDVRDQADPVPGQDTSRSRRPAGSRPVRRRAAGPRAPPPAPRPPPGPRRARPARRRTAPRAPAAARSATRPARHDVHAFGEVARASASVSTSSRSSVSASGIRSATYADGGGVLEVAGGGDLGEQQVPADQPRRPGDLAGVEPHPGRRLGRERLARDGVVDQLALADVVQQRGGHQHVGPGHPADQPGGLDAGLHQVPVDGEAVHHRGVRQQPDPLPLGQHPRPGRRSRRASPSTGSSPGPAASSRTNRSRASLGPRLRQRGHSARASRAAVAGASTTLALGGLGGRAEQQQRVRGRVGAPRRGRPRRRRRRPRARPARRSGRPARGPRRVGASTASTRLPGEPREVGDPAADARAPAAAPPRRRAARAARPGRATARGRSGRWRGRRRRAARRGGRAAAAGRGSRSACETSTSQVATSALSTVASRSPPDRLLEVRDRDVRELALPGPAPVDQLRERGQLARGRRAASARAASARSRSVTDGSPARCRASSRPERHPRVGARPRR